MKKKACPNWRPRASVCESNKLDYEILFIDDGSKAKTVWEVIEQLQRMNPFVRGIKFQRNYGKSAALHTGFQATEGEVGSLSTPIFRIALTKFPVWFRSSGKMVLTWVDK